MGVETDQRVFICKSQLFFTVTLEFSPCRKNLWILDPGPTNLVLLLNTTLNSESLSPSHQGSVSFLSGLPRLKVDISK